MAEKPGNVLRVLMHLNALAIVLGDVAFQVNARFFGIQSKLLGRLPQPFILVSWYGSCFFGEH